MKQTTMRILVLVLVLCFIPAVFTGCMSQPTPQEILTSNYSNWSWAFDREDVFTWKDKTYQVVDVPEDLQSHIDTFYVEEYTLRSTWSENACILSTEEGEDREYYLLRSDIYPSLYFLVPHKEFRKLFDESHPFAFCLEAVGEQG